MWLCNMGLPAGWLRWSVKWSVIGKSVWSKSTVQQWHMKVHCLYTHAQCQVHVVTFRHLGLNNYIYLSMCFFDSVTGGNNQAILFFYFPQTDFQNYLCCIFFAYQCLT